MKSRASVVHSMKSWTHLYQAIASGQKTHDLRKNDREYVIGDIIELKEFDFVKGEYTGDTCLVEITYITSSETPCAFSSSVLENGYSILSVKLVGPSQG